MREVPIWRDIAARVPVDSQAARELCVGSDEVVILLEREPTALELYHQSAERSRGRPYTTIEMVEHLRVMFNAGFGAEHMAQETGVAKKKIRALCVRWREAA